MDERVKRATETYEMQSATKTIMLSDKAIRRAKLPGHKAHARRVFVHIYVFVARATIHKRPVAR